MHLVIDTRGLPLMVMVPPADLHDSAAREVLFRLRLTHPEITIVWVVSVCAGKLVTWEEEHLNLTIKTVSRPKNTSGWVLLPRRWVVERSLAWMINARRHARDYERLSQHSETLITCAAITEMTRRITRSVQSVDHLPPGQLAPSCLITGRRPDRCRSRRVRSADARTPCSATSPRPRHG